MDLDSPDRTLVASSSRALRTGKGKQTTSHHLGEARDMHEPDRSMSPPNSSQVPRPSDSPERTIVPPTASRRGRRAAPYRAADLADDAVPIAGPSRPRKVAAVAVNSHSSTRVSRTTRAARQGAASAVPTPIDVDEDDEPVFVGQSMAKRLSEKFAFRRAQTSSPAGSGDEAIAKPSAIRSGQPSGRALASNANGRSKVKGKDQAVEDGFVGASSGDEAGPSRTRRAADALNEDDIQVVQVIEKRRPGRPKKIASTTTASTTGPARKGSRAKSASTASRPADTAPASVSGPESPNQPGPPPLQLMPFREPLPVPAWLGKPSVLLPLRDCPICHRRWTKSEQGVKRWKHISTCLPPSHKPSDDPLDLQSILNDALIALSGPRPSYTLLDTYADAPDVRDNRASFVAVHAEAEADLPQANQADQARLRTEAKEKAAAAAALQPSPRNMRPVGLKSVTYVKPVDACGEGEWDAVIEGRLRAVIGSSPPPIAPRLTGAGTPDDDIVHGFAGGSAEDEGDARWEAKEGAGDTDVEMDVACEEIVLPTTQPIGDSQLARHFSRAPHEQSLTEPEGNPPLLTTKTSRTTARLEQESVEAPVRSLDRLAGGQEAPVGNNRAPPAPASDSPPYSVLPSTKDMLRDKTNLSRTSSLTSDFGMASEYGELEAPTASQKRRARGRFIVPSPSSISGAQGSSPVIPVMLRRRRPFDQGEACELKGAFPDMISAHRRGDGDDGYDPSSSDIVKGSQDVVERESSPVEQAGEQVGQEEEEEPVEHSPYRRPVAPDLETKKSDSAFSAGSSVMSLDTPFELGPPIPAADSPSSVGREDKAGGPRGVTVFSFSSSPIQPRSSLSEYRSPRRTPSPASPYTPERLSSFGRPRRAKGAHGEVSPLRGRRQRRLAGRSPAGASVSSASDSPASLRGTPNSGTMSTPAGTALTDRGSGRRPRIVESVSPLQHKVERMTDPAAPSSDRSSPAPRGEEQTSNLSDRQAGRMPQARSPSMLGDDEPGLESGHDSGGPTDVTDDYQWGHDAMLDWEGEADDSFLHYEPDEAHSRVGAAESEATDTEDAPVAASPARSRSGVRVPQKRTLIDLTGSSGEIPVAVTPAAVIGPRRRAASTSISGTDTEADASSVAPEDAGLDPEHLDDDGDDDDGQYGYGYQYDEWAEWGNDAYMSWEAEETLQDAVADAREMSLPGSAEAEISEVEEEEEAEEIEAIDEVDDGDMTLTNAPSIDDTETHTPTPKTRRRTATAPASAPASATGARERQSGKGRGTETVEELRERGMPDYTMWELKKLQRLCTGYGYRTSTKHSALVDIAVECWRAMNPKPVIEEVTISPLGPKARDKGKGKAKSQPNKAERDQLPASPQPRQKVTTAMATRPPVKTKASGSALVASGEKQSASAKVVAPTPRTFALVDVDAYDVSSDSDSNAAGTDSDISSADVPLAKTARARTAKATGGRAAIGNTTSKGKAKAKAKGAAHSRDLARPNSVTSDAESITSAGTATGTEAESVTDARPVEERFRDMIRADAELYLRILHYEPIHFDEFVSKAIRAGVKDRKDKGWKIALKKFLDFEGITFYTEDPTGGSRRRH